ncbi:dTDP-4-dehydrorhamnose reductase [Mesonia aestuariivivens]|uniref:dTDP-4-dehydrorhamnose reductase n=1 Tax=Mesonia aestuariivivens TaxID=2796128 RepID=A0ABS6W100_9FLAO|nr:dTDP-4-dehydrorhamnose reductase [Mesonia aestuariivivens]MBW2961533.1 dTDP-4-dehydrorhamnose reductase [Mesonia aestuariivivens]
MKILVTGANGQLGQCLKKQSSNFLNLELNFFSSSNLDITNSKAVSNVFKNGNYDWCINCAAYTNVEKAESDSEKAFLVNAEAVKQLSKICQENAVKLIHISTDYVFNGKQTSAYKETDTVNPINIYGASKLKGEEFVQQELDEYFILRTSWLYSEFGHNFFNNMLKKAKEKEVELKITTAQSGTPTNANDLASVALKIISENRKDFGIYHFSNEGEATWYDFAKAIFTNSDLLSKVTLIASNEYKTIAQRPVNSVLSKEKIKKNLQVTIPTWQHSLLDLQKSI